MSVRHLLETQFPLSSTEYQPSLEGFMDKLKGAFRRNKNDNNSALPERAEHYYTLINDTLLKTRSSDITFVEGTAELSERASSFFERNGKPVSSPITELKKDISDYVRLYGRVKPTISKFNAYVASADRDFSAFLRKDKGDDLNGLVELLKKYNKAPTMLSEVFNEPNIAFLGFNKDPFQKDNDFSYRVKDGVITITPEKTSSHELPALTPSELTELTKAMKTLSQLVVSIIEFKDTLTAGLDISDPPFRGYSNQLFKSKELSGLINNAKFLHPFEYTDNAAILDNLLKRLHLVFMAYAEYVHKSITFKNS